MLQGNWNNFKLGNGNRTLTYVLPMLGKKVAEFKSKYLPGNQFVNAFIGDVERPDLKDCILLLYKFSGHKDFIEFEKRLQSRPGFVEKYEPDHLHTMYVFKVPDVYLPQYDLFKRSLYSKFSKEFKEHIANFHDFSPNHPVVKVLTKHEDVYEEWEKQIGQKISREQEAGTIILEHMEYYQPEYKVKKPMSMLQTDLD